MISLDILDILDSTKWSKNPKYYILDILDKLDGTKRTRYTR